MQSLKVALKGYYNEYGQFPKGDSKEIVAILLGKNLGDQNPRNIIFIGFRSGELDGQGNCLDAWKQPIVISIESDSNVLIHSFGPNGKDENGNGDDLMERIR